MIPELLNTEYCLRFKGFLEDTGEILKGPSITLSKREIATQHVRARFHELLNIEHLFRFNEFF